jgi:hypothetical protein
VVLKVWQNFPNLHQKNKFKNICSHSGNPPPPNTSLNGLAWLQRQAIAQMSKKGFQALFLVLSSLSHPQFLVFLGAII